MLYVSFSSQIQAGISFRFYIDICTLFPLPLCVVYIYIILWLDFCSDIRTVLFVAYRVPAISFYFLCSFEIDFRCELFCAAVRTSI